VSNVRQFDRQTSLPGIPALPPAAPKEWRPKAFRLLPPPPRKMAFVEVDFVTSHTHLALDDVRGRLDRVCCSDRREGWRSLAHGSPTVRCLGMSAAAFVVWMFILFALVAGIADSQGDQ
jgi:hypothetical protein